MQVPSVKSEPMPQAPYGTGNSASFVFGNGKSAAFGFETKVIDDAIGYAQWGPEGLDYIGILGHLDVVPAGSDWDFPPFDLSEKTAAFMVGEF